MPSILARSLSVRLAKMAWATEATARVSGVGASHVLMQPPSVCCAQSASAEFIRTCRKDDGRAAELDVATAEDGLRAAMSVT